MLIFGLWLGALLLSMPVMAIGATALLSRRAALAIRSSTWFVRWSDDRATARLRTKWDRLRTRESTPTAEGTAREIRKKLEKSGVSQQAMLEQFQRSAAELFHLEDVEGPWPSGANEMERAHQHDRLADAVEKLARPSSFRPFKRAVSQAFQNLVGFVPAGFARENQQHHEGLTVRLLDVVREPGKAVEAVIGPFCVDSSHSGMASFFTKLNKRLVSNAHKVSGIESDPFKSRRVKLIRPTEFKGSPHDVVEAFLGGTPLKPPFECQIPFDIPDTVRMEHTWICAGSGHGKTQALQCLISTDLASVARGDASVVVIDSQGDLINNIASLKVFAPGQPLHDRLCLIDPTDIEYPVALNLFDTGLRRLDGYSALNRERLLNSVVELYDFVLGSLLAAEMTQKQAVIFRYITRLMLQIPCATIHTFRELMDPNGAQKYAAYFAQLDGTARLFFETEFNSRQFEETKRQVARRLWGILENRTFERMFSHPVSKLDLFSEMNAGKVILINTAKDLLKQTGSEIFGRFFLALIAQAAQERAILSATERKPTFVYVDECAEYLDQNVFLILETARKQCVGITLAHQYIGQLSSRLQESFGANTSTKLVGGVSDKDAKQFAHMLRCDPDFILDRPKGNFAAQVRGVADRAVSVRIPFGILEAMPKATPEEFGRMKARVRAQYAHAAAGNAAEFRTITASHSAASTDW